MPTVAGDALALRFVRVFRKAAGVHRVLDVLVANQRSVCQLGRNAQPEPLGGAAAVFTDDDPPRAVDESPRPGDDARARCEAITVAVARA